MSQVAEAVSERPIVFDGAMVRAILSDRKTTARLICASAVSDCPCPYGEKGDRLWLCETWANLSLPDYPPVISYRADDPPDASERNGWGLPPGVEWQPAITMPRWACRLTLEITDVCLERSAGWVITFRRIHENA